MACPALLGARDLQAQVQHPPGSSLGSPQHGQATAEGTELKSQIIFTRVHLSLVQTTNKDTRVFTTTGEISQVQ